MSSGRSQSSVHPEHEVDHEISNDIEVVTKPVQAKKATGVLPIVCALTLVGNRLGGGVVGVPFAVKTTGYTAAICFSIFHAICSIFAFYLFLKVKDIIQRSSLSDLGIYCYGKFSIYMINSSVAFAQLGFPIIFFIVFGDVAGALIDRAYGSSSFLSSRWCTHTALAVLMLYMILKKEIQQLKYAGIFLFCSISFFVLIFFIHYLTSDPDPENKTDLVKSDMNISFFAALPTIMSSYGFHPAFFTAYNSLKVKNNKNGMYAGTLAVILAFLIYACTPLISFGLYGDDVKSNLLKSVSEEEEALTTVLEFLFMILAIVHIPITFFIGKEAVLIIFDEATRHSYTKHLSQVGAENPSDTQHELKMNSALNLNKQHEHLATYQPEVPDENAENENKHSNEEKSEEESKEPMQHFENRDVIMENSGEAKNNQLQENSGESSESTKSEPINSPPNPKEYLNMKPVYYYMISLTCFFIVVLLSIVVGDVKIFFGLIGATASSWVIYLGPGSFYVIAVHKKNVAFKNNSDVLLYISAWAMTILGIIGIIGLNTVVILNAI